MTRSEATLLIVIVVAAFAVFAASGVEIHHLAHHFGQALQPSRFGQ
jgi:hypothetical protein